MKVIKTIADLQEYRKNLTSQNVGFVPTMGNLHEGHASLCKRSKDNNDITIASIFINPTQFNQFDDFNKYPRTLEKDLKLLEKIGVDLCFVPNSGEIYNDNYNYRVVEHDLSLKYEGESRPGHFCGVLTVVLKLLNLIRPNFLYLGEKDFQQYLLIKGMIGAFFLDIEVILCPTIRDDKGLALSSRNNRLSHQERLRAQTFASIFLQDKPLAEIEKELRDHNINIDYLFEMQGRRFVAVLIGSVRLIDNCQLTALSKISHKSDNC